MTLKTILLFIMFIHTFALCSERTPLSDVFITAVPIDTSVPYTGKWVPYTGGALPISSPGIYEVRGTFHRSPNVQEPTGLFIMRSTYPCRIYLNGCKVFQWGNTLTSFRMSHYESTSIPVELTQRGTDSIRILFYTDGKKSAIPELWLANQNQTDNYVYWQNLVNSSFIRAMVLFSFACSIGLFYYYRITKKRYRDVLYVALLALCEGLAFLIFVFDGPSIPELPLFKLSRIGFCVTAVCSLFYITELCGVTRKRTYRVPFLVLTILSSIAILFAGSKIEVDKINAIATFTILFPIFLINAAIIIHTTKNQWSVDHLAALIGIICMIVFSTADLWFVVTLPHLPYAWLSPYGQVMVTLSMLFIIGRREAITHNELIAYKTELSRTNQTLELRVKERTTELLEANQKLKELNQMKSDFTTTVSHELRTPLTSVLGFAKMIRKKMDEVLFPVIISDDPKVLRSKYQVQENVNIIITEGERLTNLINDLLDIAKMEAGKIAWRSDLISPTELINRAVTATSSLFEKKDLPCRILIEPNLPKIQGDMDRLILVLINLLSNAVKFTDTGFITIQVKRLERSLLFSITDTGNGISPEFHLSVFDKFTQVGDILSDKPKGTGLGLPICKEIVEHHGGTIHVESEPGKGSSFIFEIPIL